MSDIHAILGVAKARSPLFCAVRDGPNQLVETTKESEQLSRRQALVYARQP